MAKWEITPMVWGSDYDVWARRGMYYVTNKKRVIVYSVRLDDEGSQLKVKTLEEAKRYVADMQRELKRLDPNRPDDEVVIEEREPGWPHYDLDEVNREADRRAEGYRES